MTVSSDSASATPAQDPISLLDHFADLPDPRREQGRIHRLDEIIFIAHLRLGVFPCACPQLGGDRRLCPLQGANWPETFLELPGGIPSHDTFRRVFCLLDPLAFQKGFSFLDDGAAYLANGIDPRRHRFALVLRRRSPSTVRPERARCAWHRRPLGPASGERLGGREPFDLGAGGDRRQIQRNYGHSRLARDAGPQRGRGDHRRHGLSERHRRQDHRRGVAITSSRSRRTSRTSTRTSQAGRSTRHWIRASPGWTSLNVRDGRDPQRSPGDPEFAV